MGNETALLPVNQPFTMTGALEISAPAGRGDLRQAVYISVAAHSSEKALFAASASPEISEVFETKGSDALSFIAAKISAPERVIPRIRIYGGSAAASSRVIPMKEFITVRLILARV